MTKLQYLLVGGVSVLLLAACSPAEPATEVGMEEAETVVEEPVVGEEEIMMEEGTEVVEDDTVMEEEGL